MLGAAQTLKIRINEEADDHEELEVFLKSTLEEKGFRFLNKQIFSAGIALLFERDLAPKTNND